jgi:hypothetical protein
MTMTFQLQEQPDGWAETVIEDGEPMGRIMKHGEGYALFAGLEDFTTPLLESADLEALKSQIRALQT